MVHENSGFSILHPKYSSSNKLKQQHVNFHNFATSWRALVGNPKEGDFM
jgi:hypothetical protein